MSLRSLKYAAPIALGLLFGLAANGNARTAGLPMAEKDTTRLNTVKSLQNIVEKQNSVTTNPNEIRGANIILQGNQFSLLLSRNNIAFLQMIDDISNLDSFTEAKKNWKEKGIINFQALVENLQNGTIVAIFQNSQEIYIRYTKNSLNQDIDIADISHNAFWAEGVLSPTAIAETFAKAQKKGFPTIEEGMILNLLTAWQTHVEKFGIGNYESKKIAKYAEELNILELSSPSETPLPKDRNAQQISVSGLREAIKKALNHCIFIPATPAQHSTLEK